MKPLFLIPILLFFSSCVKTQTISKDNTEIKFTQAWVWEYENELIPGNEPGHQGEMVVYFEPDLNYWLFTMEAYGTSGEMFEWIIGKPDGTYILSSMDEFGTRAIQQEKIEFRKIEFDFKPTGSFQKYQNFNIGFPPVEAEKFELNYLKTNDKTEIYLSDLNVDFQPLYFFNQLNSEAKLPVYFPAGLNSNKLVCEENTISNGKRIRYKLTDISHTEHYIYFDKNLN